MDAQMTLAELFLDGANKIGKEQAAEIEAQKEEKERQNKTFLKLWSEIRKQIPAAFYSSLIATDEDIRELLVRGVSKDFKCQLKDSAPIYLFIDTRNGITVEYLIPAIFLSSKNGFRLGLSKEDHEYLWGDFAIIQTDDPSKAVFLAHERMLDFQNTETQIKKPEPEYESIEKTMMVNPSLDDLINLRIEQALKKAMA